MMHAHVLLFFFFNDTATPEIYTLSLHDALPISPYCFRPIRMRFRWIRSTATSGPRSEEHTSELQSRSDLVCRLLLEKKKHRKRTTKTCANALATTHDSVLPNTA